MDRPRYYHTKRSQKQIPYDITYMWNLKYDTDQYTYEKKKKRLTDRKQTCGCQEGR